MKNLKSILVAYDFSDYSDKALECAIMLAKVFEARIWLIHVADPEPDFVGFGAGPDAVRKNVANELKDDHRRLQLIAEGIEDNDIQITPISIQGSIVETINAQAQKLDADLIVIGHKGKNKLETALIGSVSKQIISSTSRSVLVCS